MTLKEKIETLVRLHLLIKRKATGSPAELARRLGVSQPTIFRYLNALRDFDAPIEYCNYRKSYYYVEEYKLNFY
ncbi:MAG: HTH domain-containing protein [Bacteroidota bacterium]